MSTVKPHTSLPWDIGMKPGPMIYGPLGEQVADCRGVMELRESCLDATYIAHACNNHESLVNALKLLRDEFVKLANQHDYCGHDWPCLYNVDYAIEQAEGRDK